MDLLEDSKMSLLSFKFVMVYIIHKMLVLLKNHLNYIKDSIFECFFKEYNRVFFQQKMIFSNDIMMESFRLKEENINKGIRNLFRLKKELYIDMQKLIANIKNKE